MTLSNTVRMPRAITTTTLRAAPKGKATEPVVVETLRTLISYDPETGEMTWLPRPWNVSWTSRHAGKTAMTALHPDGYRVGKLFETSVLAHRVAFALAHGRWPAGTVVARNGDLRDLRAVNLVETTVSFHQQRAAKKPRKDSSSGVTGVTFDRSKGKWLAHIKIAGRHRNLGKFKTIEEAAAARKAAEKSFGVSAKHIEKMLLQEAPAHA